MSKRNWIIGITGYGYVGKAMHDMFKKHYEVRIWSPQFGDKCLTTTPDGNVIETESKETLHECDITIVCAPTPMSKDDFVEVEYESGKKMRVYRCDTRYVEQNVRWLRSKIILIKSTVEVGTTDRLKQETGKHIVFSPEYVGETKYHVTDRMNFHTQAVRTPFFICGGDQQDCQDIFDMLTPVMGPECHYKAMPARDAEFVKYIENDYFFRKVMWANEKRDQADALGVNWHNAREGWGLDPRVDKMHTAVFPGNQGVSGKCLPKDANALTYSSLKAGYTPTIELAQLKKNLEYRGVDDYKELETKITQGED